VKRGWILAIIAANLVAVTALVFTFPHLMISPGALVPEHRALATDCFACHAPLRGASSSRCVTCHALPDIGLRTTQGVTLAKPSIKASFHQSLTETNCMACHSDHAQPKLVRGNRKSFSHSLLRTDIRDQCASCHVAPTNAIHSNQTVGCNQCHKPEQWKPATFDHNKYFLLDRDHNTTCITCHVNSDYKRFTCYGCHEHTPEKIRRKHTKEGISNFENCVKCHRSAEGEPEGKGNDKQRERD
jgi:Class III cytochrome C family